MSFAVPRTLSLSLLAALVLAGCAEAARLKGEKPVDVASVVRQNALYGEDRNAWAEALAKTFESQKIAPTGGEYLLGTGNGAAGVNVPVRPGGAGAEQNAQKEIDRRAESMHIPVFWCIPPA